VHDQDERLAGGACSGGVDLAVGGGDVTLGYLEKLLGEIGWLLGVEVGLLLLVVLEWI